MEISTRHLEGLPDVLGLRRLLQSMAMLDAIVEPKPEYRYYSFNAHWAQGEMMGSMNNGSGDEFFALFTGHGAFLKGVRSRIMRGRDTKPALLSRPAGPIRTLHPRAGVRTGVRYILYLALHRSAGVVA
jgi:hypothetical protein